MELDKKDRFSHHTDRSAIDGSFAGEKHLTRVGGTSKMVDPLEEISEEERNMFKLIYKAFGGLYRRAAQRRGHK